MKFEQFLESKGVSYTKIYESNERLYEAEDGFIADLMKRIKGRLAYAKCKGLIPKYAEAALEANQYMMEFQIHKKTMQVFKKIEALETKKENVKDRDQKSKIIDQVKKLKDVNVDLTAKGEVVAEQKKNQLQRITDELDEQLALVEDTDLKGLITMKKKEASYAASEEGFEKKAIMAREKGHDGNADAAVKDKEKLHEKADELLKKLSTAEDAAAGELEDIQIEDGIKTEIITFIKTGNDIKASKKQFMDLWDDADRLVPSTESEDFDFDSFYKSITEEVTDEKPKFKGPKEVLQHINAIPDTDGDTDNADAKQGLYDKLKPLTATYKTRVEANIEAKKAIKAKCDEMITAKQKVTKDMLTIAGYDPEDIKTTEENDEAGKTKKVNTPGELLPVWKAAFDDPAEYGPLKAIAEVQAEIDEKGKEGVPAPKVPASEVDDKQQKKDALQRDIDDLTQQISELEGKSERTPDEEDELEILKSTKREKEEEKAGLDESVNTPAVQAPKGIMKFADFIASKK